MIKDEAMNVPNPYITTIAWKIVFLCVFFDSNMKEIPQSIRTSNGVKRLCILLLCFSIIFTLFQTN